MTDEMENLKDPDSDAVSGPARRGLRLLTLFLVPLVALGLFLFAGSLLMGDSDDNGQASLYEDQAMQIERVLIVSPQDPELLLNLTGARFNAGSELVNAGSRKSSKEVIQQFRLASEAWSKYLGVVSEPSVRGAKSMEPVFVTLAEAADDVGEFRKAMRGAAEVAEVVSKQDPSVDSLMRLAYYRDFAFDWKAADRASREALALARTQPELEKVQHALREYQRTGREIKSELSR